MTECKKIYEKVKYSLVFNKISEVVDFDMELIEDKMTN